MSSLWKNRRHSRRYPPLTQADFFKMETGILNLILEEFLGVRGGGRGEQRGRKVAKWALRKLHGSTSLVDAFIFWNESIVNRERYVGVTT